MTQWQKSDWRYELVRRRASVSSEARLIAEKKSCKSLLSLLQVMPPAAVFLYRSYGSEFPTYPMIEVFLEHSWMVLAPSGEGSKTSVDELIYYKSGGWQTAVSSAAEEMRQKTTVILLPGLGFDGWGNRLGRGGGYYDKVLTLFPTQALRLGVGFLCQCLGDGMRLPCESWDEPVHVVLTENGFRGVDHVRGFWCEWKPETK